MKKRLCLVVLFLVLSCSLTNKYTYISKLEYQGEMSIKDFVLNTIYKAKGMIVGRTGRKDKFNYGHFMFEMPDGTFKITHYAYDSAPYYGYGEKKDTVHIVYIRFPVSAMEFADEVKKECKGYFLSLERKIFSPQHVYIRMCEKVRRIDHHKIKELKKTMGRNLKEMKY